VKIERPKKDTLDLHPLHSTRRGKQSENLLLLALIRR